MALLVEYNLLREPTLGSNDLMKISIANVFCTATAIKPPWQVEKLASF